ncbi:MAG: hypothetical protein AMK71_03310 [Nitrospira bacterium SG8_35_4]|nr:MAG: hypothetical protein AMK71_03310 [Nitrospira bacterium SG8_35_4]
MIIDLPKFLSEGKKYWSELEAKINALEKYPEKKMTIEQTKQFHYLYQRISSDLEKVRTFASEPDILHYLESLTARAYCEIHETRKRPHRIAPVHWFFVTFPQTVRRHSRTFTLSMVIMLAGFAFGGFAVSFDSDARDAIIPHANLLGDPAERVREEESVKDDHLKGIKMRGASFYMTHNTKVAVATMAMGITWGVGTVIMLFYNGAMLGAVALDYVIAGESEFLMAWLSPHGVVEIPAILLAGQAGLILAGALIGWGKRISLRQRMKRVSNDLLTLIFGVALMLVWAGIIEAFVSQYHEPVIPYAFKISFAAIELLLLTLFLLKSGADHGPE